MVSTVSNKPYDVFVAKEASGGVPVHELYAVDDLFTLEVGPWNRIGGDGCYVHLNGRGPSNAYIQEIAAGKELKEQRHLYEESVFVTSGTGRTELWNDEGFSVAFNWEKGAVFNIPLNVHFKHMNLNAAEPTRLFYIKNQPLMMNIAGSEEFIFGCEFDFTDRFSSSVTDFSKPLTWDDKRLFTGNMIASAFDCPLPVYEHRGGGGSLLSFDLANSTLSTHMSEFPGGRYKKAHRHGPGAHVILLSGTGFSLLWKEGEEPRRFDWKPGCVIVPPDRTFHQHFNTGETPARYLALKLGRKIILDDAYDLGKSTREGGDQIEYEDEDPKIRATFEAALAAAS